MNHRPQTLSPSVFPTKTKHSRLKLLSNAFAISKAIPKEGFHVALTSRKYYSPLTCP